MKYFVTILILPRLCLNIKCSPEGKKIKNKIDTAQVMHSIRIACICVCEHQSRNYIFHTY